MIDLWKTRGVYSVEKERDYYGQSQADKTALAYDHVTKYFTGSVGEDFFRDKKVLDLGCGEGVYSAWIADNGGAESVLGLDLTDHRIRWDYEKNLPNLRFVPGDIFNPNLDGRKFDIVFMNLVLHHLRFNLEGAAKSIASCLKQNGTFLAFEPNVYSPLAILAHIYHHKSENEGFVSPLRIRGVFQKTGFKDVEFGFFWRDRKWARNPLLASAFWIKASRRSSQ